MESKSGKNMVTFGRKLPIGIQTFEKLRNEDYLYVDKTEQIWQLAANRYTDNRRQDSPVETIHLLRH